ncbi:MAG: metal-sulfur cluster assembly factor [Nanopusillaceae archaeon]
MVSEEMIKERLKEVIDPEIGYDIISLGEIEEIKIKNNEIYIKFLPTTPLCPFIPAILEGIKEKLQDLANEYKINIEIDFENQWSIERVDPGIRKELGI